jgi:hypothetical protein
MIRVISTGYNAPTKERCLASVRAQIGVDYQAVYIEAGKQNPPLSALENLYREVHACNPHDIIVCLDGDDWFADDRVLYVVQSIYRGEYTGRIDAWVTYGSFVYADGRQGFAAPYKPNENVRRTPWRATHLKTFRAGLFQQIDPRDLKDDAGEWFKLAIDQATMFPLLEMAGPYHSLFVPGIMVVYNFESSWEANPSTQLHERYLEQQTVRYIRNKPSYKPVESYDRYPQFSKAK